MYRASEGVFVVGDDRRGGISRTRTRWRGTALAVTGALTAGLIGVGVSQARAGETTASVDSLRTGWDQGEGALSAAAVRSSSFGQLWKAPVGRTPWHRQRKASACPRSTDVPCVVQVRRGAARQARRGNAGRPNGGRGGRPSGPRGTGPVHHASAGILNSDRPARHRPTRESPRRMAIASTVTRWTRRIESHLDSATPHRRSSAGAGPARSPADGGPRADCLVARVSPSGYG